MRAQPQVTFYSTDGTSNKFRDRINNSNVVTGGWWNENGYTLDVSTSGPATEMWFEGHVVADAEL